MSSEYERLHQLAVQCMNIVSGRSDLDDDDMRTCLDVGEPDLVIATALDVAGRKENRELLPQFPEQVKELANNPRYPEIGVYADLFNNLSTNNLFDFACSPQVCG
ncbi:hypothetical protein PG2093B_1372 [Bifidobacterium pseudolongum subsp. globosum]|uniref:Uncharacterized protein n=1 Tax=Bifidobacterium pseudolongum subsp. globosum TaxID=1690 RepID=A0A4V1Y1M5_9BIFI|nr:hypothetical protein [Bifidobacterium pseudolongum]RYQ09088.1 hypothetical protein PG2093B_1372 [Bifidobacterium pseudolongum subsp. globosum]